METLDLEIKKTWDFVFILLFHVDSRKLINLSKNQFLYPSHRLIAKKTKWENQVKVLYQLPKEKFLFLSYSYGFCIPK